MQPRRSEAHWLFSGGLSQFAPACVSLQASVNLNGVLLDGDVKLPWFMSGVRGYNAYRSAYASSQRFGTS